MSSRIDAREVGVGNAGDDLLPRLAEVRGLVDVRLAIAHLVAVGGEVGHAVLMRRRFDQADARELRQIGRRDALPVLAAVTRDVHPAVVRAGPDRVDVLPRRREREHHRVGFDAGLVLGDRAARRLHRLRIRARQVRADALPALAVVGGAPDVLRRGVEHLRIDRREHDRVGPLEAFLDVDRGIPHRVVRIDVDRALLAGLAIEAAQVAAVAAGEEHVEVFRIGRDVAALAAADRVEDRRQAALARAGVGLAADAGRAVVLLRAADVIRHVLGREHVVELPGRNSPGRSTSGRR